jgi:hypothetical protein
VDQRKVELRARNRPLYWAAMTAQERKLAPEVLGNVDFAEELGLVRVNILRLARDRSRERGSTLEQTRLMLGLLDVLTRLGNLQAKVERAGDGAGELNESFWDVDSIDAGR